jgi:hypothetical protein
MNTGTCGQPSLIARVLPDGTTQSRWREWEAITSQIILLSSDAVMTDYEPDGLVIAR